jgi:hypothetical protein
VCKRMQKGIQEKREGSRRTKESSKGEKNTILRRGIGKRSQNSWKSYDLEHRRPKAETEAKEGQGLMLAGKKSSQEGI